MYIYIYIYNLKGINEQKKQKKLKPEFYNLIAQNTAKKNCKNKITI